ncbi:hypothetical protein SSX86_002056 [Deinandra increscens subsp. villosa]|uniref:Uncharacterized protein n=1 Tax=Deinandra increscens subsp. villosa TaxID=3103831 RepID=A0AAP0H9A2_9ASTR
MAAQQQQQVAVLGGCSRLQQQLLAAADSSSGETAAVRWGARGQQEVEHSSVAVVAAGWRWFKVVLAVAVHDRKGGKAKERGGVGCGLPRGRRRRKGWLMWWWRWMLVVFTMEKKRKVAVVLRGCFFGRKTKGEERGWIWFTVAGQRQRPSGGSSSTAAATVAKWWLCSVQGLLRRWGCDLLVVAEKRGKEGAGRG